MILINAAEACPFCRRTRPEVFWEGKRVPVFCNVLGDCRQSAQAARREPIRLGYCPECGGICNIDFDRRLMIYHQRYENSLHHSERFRRYAGMLAEELVDRYGLRGKDVLEIGCGGGHFLEMLRQAGGNRCLGFDPSAAARSSTCPSGGSVTIVRHAFTGIEDSRNVDFLCCRHVLEHIADPRAFLTMARQALGERLGVGVFFEVPNALWVLQEEGIWDIIYEHCSYFTAPALDTLFAATGFRDIHVEEQFGRQYLTVNCRPAHCSPDTPKPVNEPVLAEIAGLVRRFGEVYREKAAYWAQRLRRLRSRRHRAVVWGAGSKGVTFLNVLEADDGTIPYVIDINPAKHGRYIPGTGQRVVGPEILAEYRPELVLVMNPLYEDEVRSMVEQELGDSAELCVV
jgi:SAM-dependent methyltransferase